MHWIIWFTVTVPANVKVTDCNLMLVNGSCVSDPQIIHQCVLSIKEQGYSEYYALQEANFFCLRR